VRDATLRVYVGSTNWTGSVTITAKRVETDWKEQQTGYAENPTVSSTNSGSVTVSGATLGDTISIPVTALLQNVASGSPYFGIRLETNVSKTIKIHSSETTVPEKRPDLDLEWARIPMPPTDLRPSGERNVSASRPTLLWRFRDRFGDQNQAKSQVEVRTTADVLVYDSGMVTNIEQSFDLSAPPAGAPSFSAMTDGQTLKWRVKAQDGDGLTSDWSDYARFTYRTKGTLDITLASTVNETTPPIPWSFTGRTQEQVKVDIEEWQTVDRRWALVHRLPRVMRTQASSYTIPEGVLRLRNHDYRARVRVWDTFDREDLPGAPSYVEDTQTFQYSRSGAPTAITGLVVTSGAAPSVTIEWSRGVRPDFFALRVDDELIDDRLDPDDIETTPGGTTYHITYWGAQPWTAHLYEISAVVKDTGVFKESNTVGATATASPIGIWLLEPEEGTNVAIWGREQPSESIGESATTHEPIGRRSPSRWYDSIRGYEGSISGVILDFEGVTANTFKNRLLAIKKRRGSRQVRLSFAKRNIPILLEEISCTPSAEIIGGYEVSIAYRQNDRFF
jgi:hypothetical protein